MSKDHQKSLLLNKLKQQTSPIALSELLQGLELSYSARAVRRWLDEWIKMGVVHKTGKTAGARYFIAENSPSEFAGNYFSSESLKIIKQLKTQYELRKPVEYQPKCDGVVGFDSVKALQAYTFEYRVHHDDLDFMGIVGNAEWVTFLTRARIDLLDKINYPLSEMIKQRIGGVVSEMTVKYLKPAKLGDSLIITITVAKQFEKGLVLHYVIHNKENIECLIADVTLIFINHEGTPIAMPEQIAAILCSN